VKKFLYVEMYHSLSSEKMKGLRMFGEVDAEDWT